MSEFMWLCLVGDFVQLTGWDEPGAKCGSVSARGTPVD